MKKIALKISLIITALSFSVNLFPSALVAVKTESQKKLEKLIEGKEKKEKELKNIETEYNKVYNEFLKMLPKGILNTKFQKFLDIFHNKKFLIDQIKNYDIDIWMQRAKSCEEFLKSHEVKLKGEAPPAYESTSGQTDEVEKQRMDKGAVAVRAEKKLEVNLPIVNLLDPVATRIAFESDKLNQKNLDELAKKAPLRFLGLPNDATKDQIIKRKEQLLQIWEYGDPMLRQNDKEKILSRERLARQIINRLLTDITQFINKL